MLKRLILVSLLLAAGSGVWIWQAYRQALSRPVVVNPGHVIEIARGDSFRTIVAKLQDQQVDLDPFWFKIIAYRMKVADKLRAGEYDLAEGMSMPDLLATFVAGKARQYSITFPEGWTFNQILQAVADNPNLEHRLTGVDPQAIMVRLGSEQQHPEGWFFPETYYFEKHSSDLDLLKRSHDKMQEVLLEEWQDRAQDLPLQTPYEALILASIVEKETAKAEERPQIAGVFVRRLQKGMLLQTDPTVIYGMGEAFDGDLRSKDLKQPTAYNTYLVKGLPPTPIAMPGRQAIRAALHPDRENSLYFVARGDGSHVFSASLREHNNAVNKYQKRSR